MLSMRIFRIGLRYLISLIIMNLLLHTSQGDEYCMTETFHAECPDNTLIMMTEAQYGMMERNRCVNPDDNLSDLGCSADALSVLDAACSNKNTCDYYIPLPGLIDIRCSREVSSLYLRASFECFRIEKPQNESPCTNPRELRIDSASGYISSALASSVAAWGSKDCPWILTGMPGQRINITVIDFKPSEVTQACHLLGYVKDVDSGNKVTICKSSQRQQHLYASSGTNVEIKIDTTSSSNTDTFLLQYQVVGCADLISSTDAWHKRKGNIGIIGCNKQNKTWHLKCDGERWQGVVGSCDDSSGVAVAPPDGQDTGFEDMFEGIPMEIILTAVAGILVLLFVCIIALCVRWKLKGQHDVNNQAIYNQSTVSSSGGYATTKPHTRSSWTCTYKAGRQHHVDHHIWETPLPEPSADEYTLPTNMRQTHGNTSVRQDNTPVPAAMLDSMEYTKPIESSKCVPNESQDDYTHPVKSSCNELNDMQTLPTSMNLSNTNYYYYDASASEQTGYMQPSNIDRTIASGETLKNADADEVPPSSPGVRIQETVNPVYKTLIRVDDNVPKI